jgi:hypothetical protein
MRRIGNIVLNTKRFQVRQTLKGYASLSVWRHSGAGRNLLAGIAILKASDFTIAE